MWGASLPYVITAARPGFAAIIQRDTASEAFDVAQARRAEGFTNVEVSRDGTNVSDAELADLARREG